MKRIINQSRLQQIGEPGFDVVSLGSSQTPLSVTTKPIKRMSKKLSEERTIRVETIPMKETLERVHRGDETNVIPEFHHFEYNNDDIEIVAP